MTTTVEAVEKHLETDPILHGALDRGVLNVRQAARWLIETNSWDTTEEAVVSALRRYDAPESYDLDDALDLLRESDFTARTGLATLSLPRTHASLSRLPRLSRAFDPEDVLTILPERKTLLLVLEESEVERALDLLGGHAQATIKRDVARMEVELPETTESASTAVSIVLNVLEYHGMEMVGVFGALPTCSILIPRERFVEANHLLNQLLSRDVTRPS